MIGIQMWAISVLFRPRVAHEPDTAVGDSIWSHVSM